MTTRTLSRTPVLAFVWADESSGSRIDDFFFGRPVATPRRALAPAPGTSRGRARAEGRR